MLNMNVGGGSKELRFVETWPTDGSGQGCAVPASGEPPCPTRTSGAVGTRGVAEGEGQAGLAFPFALAFLAFGLPLAMV